MVVSLKYWSSERRTNRRSKQEQSQACLDYALQGGGKKLILVELCQDSRASSPTRNLS